MSKLATEHILCAQCKNSVNRSVFLQTPRPSRGSEEFCSYNDRETLEALISANRCHLCSLILGNISQYEQAQQSPEICNIGPINVTLQVSRSGGVTLLIQAGDGASTRDWRRIGELSVVPSEYLETLQTSATKSTAKFTFSSQNSSIYKNAQLSKSLASVSSFALAQEWLKQCLESHSKCYEAATVVTGFPSRLVEVGNDEGLDPRIVTMHYDLEKPQQVKYLTLSHCWGGATILRLLVENLDSLAAGIPIATLPKTFKDAIIITRRLGYQYIWIDSLCIIQDSPEDWRICAAAMGEIYAGSVCTVSALTARNAHTGGCFFDHTRNPLFFRACQLTTEWWVEANTNIGTDLRTGPGSLSPMPLHTRAWVVQERILAPRTLYYGYNGLAWECVQCSATEAVPVGEVSRFSPKASFFAVRKNSAADEYYDLWTDIQIAYSRCALTRFDDRLVALAGVVKRLEMLTGWTNLWGLWRERLLLDLLWFTDDPKTDRAKTDHYLAPSWSWAGVEGRVMRAVGRPNECQWKAEAIDVGSLDGGQRGFIRLRAAARVVKWRNTAGWKLNAGIDTLAPAWEEVDWDPDVTEVGGSVETEVRCILVTRMTWETEETDIGLVVAFINEEWVRVGMFKQLREEKPLFTQNVVGFMDITIV